ncbi:PHO80 [Candida margitis]|uniref:PHO80 n=1 Tax=Candida margitis TaxID=1775924 RepID=UPI002227DF9D|nr:PHO80 [Candida margitis]KAI5958486.1 PHO80 [Candida margitis]
MMMSAPSTTQVTPTSSPTGSAGSLSKYGEGSSNISGCSRHYQNVYRSAFRQTTPSSKTDPNHDKLHSNHTSSRNPSRNGLTSSENIRNMNKGGGISTSTTLDEKRRLVTGDDTFLAQYIKSLEIQTTLNDQQLYFKTIEKQRKVKSLEIYQRYLNSNRKVDNDRDYKQYLSKISPRLQRRNVSQSEPTNEVPITAATKTSTTTTTSTTTDHPAKQSVLELQKKKQPASHITHQLPLEFMDCPIDFLIDLISRMLQSLITLNDKSVPSSISNPPSTSTSTASTASTTSAASTTSTGGQSSNSLLTRYHSRTPPAISTLTYLSRLTKFNNFNPAILLTTIYYIDLLSHQYQPFFTLNSWTVHRFLLVATMIAQKSLEDFFYTNDHYAKVGGVAIGELNCLELDFLNRVDWRCVPGKQVLNKTTGSICTNIGQAKDVLDLYYCQLIDLMGKNTHYNQGDEQPVHYIKEKSRGVGKGREMVRKEDGSSADCESLDDYVSDDGEEYDDDDDDDDDGGGDDDGDADQEEEDDVEFYDDDDDDDEDDDEPISELGGDDGKYKLHPESRQNQTEQVYDKNGFILNGSSSPHLKRRYSGSL